eukprot:s171_g4.t1
MLRSGYLNLIEDENFIAAKKKDRSQREKSQTQTFQKPNNPAVIALDGVTKTNATPATNQTVDEHIREIQQLLYKIDSLEGVCRIQQETFEEALDEKEKKIKEKDEKILQWT